MPGHAPGPTQDVPVRIAYLALQAPRPGTAAHTHVHAIVLGLRDQGFEVDLYEPGYARRARKPGAVGRLAAYLGVQLRLLARVRRYDLVYVRSHFASWPSALVCTLLPVPVVHEVNGPHADAVINNPGLRPFSGLLAAAQDWQFRRAAALVSVTPGLGEWLGARAPGVAVEVIPNGADLERFTPMREPWPGLSSNYVVFFGGLSAWHGVEWMLAAVRDPQWPDGVPLVVVGDGPGGDAVRASAGQGDPVLALGRLPHTDVGRVVAHARASLVTIVDPDGRSSTGLSPLKLFESAASGVPVIASELPGLVDLVREHELGVLVPPGDVAALARAVAERCRGATPDTRWRANLRTTASAQFSWDRRAHQTAALLRRVLDAAPSRGPGSDERP